MWALIAGAALAAVVGDGGDGTVIVEGEARRVFAPDGRLLSVGPTEDLTAAPSEAVMRGTTLVVGRCEIALGSVSGEVRTATGQGFAVVADRHQILAVDVASCTPVGALDARVSGELLVQAGPVLTVVRLSGDAVTMDRFALPTLDAVGQGGSYTRDLLPSSDGPARVVSGAVLGAEATHALPRTAKVAGGAIVVLDDDSALRVVDGDGATRAATPPHTTGKLYTATRDPTGWQINDRLVAVRVDDPAFLPATHPTGTAVVCGVDELGVVPTWPTVARATEDGAVLLTADAAEVVAWAMASRQALWRVDGPADAVAIGPDWVATRAERRWTFRDPADGRPLGALEEDGSLLVDGARADFDPARVRGATWDASVAAPTAPAPPSPFDRFHDDHGCTSQLAHLDALAPWPAAWAVARANAVFQCNADPAREPVPDWGVAPRTERGGWSWRAPEPVSALVPLGDGAVLVEAARGLGVLGPDGAPRWVRRRQPYQAGWRQVEPTVVVERDLDRSVAWDAHTGEERWSRLGWVYRDAEGWSWEVNGLVPPVAFDVDLGEPLDTPPFQEAFGRRCGGGACRPAPLREDDMVQLADGVVAALDDGRLEFRRGLEVLAWTEGVRRLAAAGPDRVIVQRLRSRRWELWTAAGRTELMARADVAAAWGDARWWVVDGVLHATGLAPAAAAASPARFVAPIPEGPPPARPVPDGPAREAWPQPPMPEGAAAVLREVAIVRDEAGLRGMAADGERWRRPGSEVSTQLGELVIDGVVVEAATGRDMGPVPDGAQRLGLRDGALLSAHVEGDDAVVRQDGVEIARLPRGSGEELGAVAADAELVYLGVGRRLVALDAAGVRWQVTLATRARADRPMVTELRVAGDLLLARTLSPLIHLKPVWAFDRRAGDVVDLLDLGRS